MPKKDFTPWAAEQNNVVEILRDRTSTPSDAALAALFEENYVTISRLRHGRAGLGPSLALRILDHPNLMDLKELRELLGPTHPLNARTTTAVVHRSLKG